MNRTLMISITEASRVGAARREALLLARAMGFNEVAAGKVGLVVTEAANNLVKHVGQGQVLLRRLGVKGARGLEVMTVDRGPGMADVTACLADGYSTAGSPGTGLGAIQRLSTVFDIYSQPGQGTVLLAQIWAQASVPAKGADIVGAVCVPLEEGDACGDAWAAHQSGERYRVLVVDGLGHGILASQAADTALRVFEEIGFGSSPAEMIRAMHGPLRSTRGASLAMAEVDHARNQVRFAGVGNVAGVIMRQGATRSMISHNGTVGHELHRVDEFSYPWSPDATLILHSDGVVSRWNLDSYHGILGRHPAIIAGVMYRDFRRGRDDVTVVVMRREESIR